MKECEYNINIFLVPGECPSGSKLGCIIPCDKLCSYYEYVLKEKGICRTEHDCAGYDCVAENSTVSCLSGQLFANEKTCVDVKDCLCTDYSGNPVKVCITNQINLTMKLYLHLCFSQVK